MINIEDHLGIARKVAFQHYRYLKDKYTYDEILSVAYEGLIKAANSFDESKGFKFTSYAFPTIVGAVKRMVRDDKWYFIKRGVKNEMLSLNFVIDNDNNIEMQDTLADEENIEEALVNSVLVSELFKLLTKKEKQVMYLYYYNNLSQKEISKCTGMSQSNVSRIMTSALKKMKIAMKIAV